MPVRAMLTTHPSGFRVFLKTEDNEQPTELKRRYEDEDQGRPLPLKFRFILAHELAHTLFYEIGMPDARPKEIQEFRAGGRNKAGGRKTILENLEKYCNRIAGHLLMPSPLFTREALKLKSLQPCDLFPFIERVGASAESVVIRLGEEDGVLIHHNLRGCIAVIQKSAKGIFVKAIAKPRSLNIAKEIRLIQSGEEWQIANSNENPVFDGETSGRMSLVLTLETRLSSIKTEHELCFSRYNKFGSEESYLVYLAIVQK